MSSVEGWDLTVPDDDAALLAELRRHGVRPGQRLHVVPATVPDAAGSPTEGPARRCFDFAGSFSAEPDLAERAEEYLQRRFGRE